MDEVSCANHRPQTGLRHFLPLLRPFRLRLFWAAVAMMLDAAITVCRPWPLKIVIDRVLAHKHTRVPFVGHWLNHAHLPPMTVLNAACATILAFACTSGLMAYLYT